jgi:hypothetical protein
MIGCADYRSLRSDFLNQAAVSVEAQRWLLGSEIISALVCSSSVRIPKCTILDQARGLKIASRRLAVPSRPLRCAAYFCGESFSVNMPLSVQLNYDLTTSPFF